MIENELVLKQPQLSSRALKMFNEIFYSKSNLNSKYLD